MFSVVLILEGGTSYAMFPVVLILEGGTSYATFSAIFILEGGTSYAMFTDVCIFEGGTSYDIFSFIFMSSWVCDEASFPATDDNRNGYRYLYEHSSTSLTR